MLKKDSAMSNLRSHPNSAPPTYLPSAVDLHIVRFTRSDVLDSECIFEVRYLLGRLVKTQGCMRVLLDMSQVTLVSAGALGIIIALNNALRPRGGELLIANISRETTEVLEITKLNRVLRIFPTMEDALAKLDHAA